MNDQFLMKKLQEVAAVVSDGHVTILKFTTNWRVGFFTPHDRDDIDAMAVGDTFEQAAIEALVRQALYTRVS